ncbi:hypothetical protein OG949_33755 [Streptomyces scopuliridis]|uniref:hypothetical protein n=1 Tax=Streptomyces scopuliridis TaxID=452529 RepID=UPI002DDA4B9D|nr:hypothetical protein [Streptomyces scopuliridis]WSB37320.1 hypothetical protein OG949_33755 [Streptomyces scopuliridis]
MRGGTVTGSRSLHDPHSAALLSNGAGRVVSPYGLTDWPGALELLGTNGPADSIRRVRQAEARTSGDLDARAPDDAAVAHCTHLLAGYGPGRENVQKPGSTRPYSPP